jgi:probable F420-dependent oxidoreductase
MRLALTLPQGVESDLQRDVAKVARQAEEAGFASLWAYERVLFPLTPAQGMYGIDGLPWMKHYEYCADPLTVLTLAGAVTQKVRLGTSVLIAPLHSTLLLARTLATLDQATGGRVVAGLGSGWSTDEYRAAGADYATRGRALDETVDGLRALLGPNPVTYSDSRMAVDNALVNPKPVGRLPILLGGGDTATAQRRIATKSDGWLAVGKTGPGIADIWKRIQDFAVEAGRDPRELELVVGTPVFLTPRPAGADRQPFQGTPDQVVEDLAAVRDAGVDEVGLVLDGIVANADEMIDQALLMRDALVSAGVVTLA